MRTRSWPTTMRASHDRGVAFPYEHINEGGRVMSRTGQEIPARTLNETRRKLALIVI